MIMRWLWATLGMEVILVTRVKRSGTRTMIGAVASIQYFR